MVQAKSAPVKMTNIVREEKPKQVGWGQCRRLLLQKVDLVLQMVVSH